MHIHSCASVTTFSAIHILLCYLIANYIGLQNLIIRKIIQMSYRTLNLSRTVFFPLNRIYLIIFYICVCVYVYVCIYIHIYTHTHIQEKEMTAHSSTLAWRIPRTGVWWTTVHGLAQNQTQLRVHAHAYIFTGEQNVDFIQHESPFLYLHFRQN